MIIITIIIIIIVMIIMINDNDNNNNNITTEPGTIITTLNKNQIYSKYPIFLFLNKNLEDSASIFKFTPLTLWHKSDCKVFWYFTYWYN